MANNPGGMRTFDLRTLLDDGADMREHFVEVHLLRKYDNYQTDVLVEIVLDGVHFETRQEQWPMGLREAINSIGIPCQARTISGIENSLRNKGYQLSFIEQFRDDLPNHTSEDGSPGTDSDPVFTHITRKYKISALDPLEQRYERRHSIASLAMGIAQKAIAKDNSDLDMAREVEKFCEQILAITARYEGRSVASYRQALPLRPDPSIIDANLTLKEGDRVHHDTFGDGDVLSINVREMFVMVRFADTDRKMALDFARLTKLTAA